MGRRKMTQEELVEYRKNHPTKAKIPMRYEAVDKTEDRAVVSKLLDEVLTEYHREKVRSDEELAERLDDYFRRCAETGQIPTIEEMSLSTGYTDTILSNWESGRELGFSKMTAQLVKKAKALVKSFDAKMVIAGKLNFLAYCFRAKNYYGMTDKQEYVLTPNTRSEEEFSAEDIRQRYMIEGDTEGEQQSFDNQL